MKVDTAIEEVKFLRTLMHGDILAFEKVKDSRAIAIARTEAEKARMWLGKLLGVLGNPHPYVRSQDVKTTVIEPMAESAEVPTVFDYTKIKDVKLLYSAYGERAFTLLEFARKNFSVTQDGYIFGMEAFKYIQLVRMQLGMRLAEIREGLEDGEELTVPPPDESIEAPEELESTEDILSEFNDEEDDESKIDSNS